MSNIGTHLNFITMETDKLIGLIIAASSVVGGLAIGAIAIMVSVPWSYKEKLAKLEASSKERLALIEKGVDPALLFTKKKTAGQDPLFWGLLLIGIGAGSFLGVVINSFTGWNTQLITNSMAILLGGIALVVYFFYRKRSDDQNKA